MVVRAAHARVQQLFGNLDREALAVARRDEVQHEVDRAPRVQQALLELWAHAPRGAGGSEVSDAALAEQLKEAGVSAAGACVSARRWGFW